MQSDGGLVEYVHHTNQAGANLTGQPNPLGLAPGQGFRAAIEGQVVEAYIHQELQAGLQFLNNFFSNLGLFAFQFQVCEIVGGLSYSHSRDCGEVVALDHYVAGVTAQSCALTVRAGLRAQVLGQFFPYHGRLCFPIAALHVGQDAFKGVAANYRVATIVDEVEIDAFTLAAPKNQLPVLARQFSEWFFQLKSVMFCQRIQHLKIIHVTAVPSAIFFQTTRLLHPVSSSRVTKVTPLAARGLCFVITSPAMQQLLVKSQAPRTQHIASYPGAHE